jgi:hypothetical protein
METLVPNVVHHDLKGESYEYFAKQNLRSAFIRKINLRKTHATA